MARTGTANGGTPLDLTAAESALAAGRQVRVTLGSTSGMPEGTRGLLVRLLDPAAGPECVVVRVDGDELPFAPAEVRAGWPRKADAPAPAAPPAPPAPRGPSEAELAAARAYAETPVRVPARAQLSAVPDPVERVPTVVPAAQPVVRPAAVAPAPRPGAAPGAPGVAKVAPAPAKRPGRKAAPRLEVTLRHGDDGWTVGATAGARVLLKGVPVEPAAAVDLAAKLDVPAISGLVAEIVDRARAEAEARVEALAAQLAAAEAELSAFGSPRRR